MCLCTRGAHPPELCDKLRCLIKFIVGVYAVSWFEIKKFDKFYDQQVYIFNMIQRIKQHSTEIQNITLKNLELNAFRKYSFLNVESRSIGGEERGYEKLYK